MVNEDALFYSRILTELTLSFHIIYATIGVGIPLMIMIAQWIGIKKNDEHYILLARRWTRGFVITVAVGVVTGPQLAFNYRYYGRISWSSPEMSLHYPYSWKHSLSFLRLFFLGIYLYTWDRFENQRKHLLLLIPVAIGASFSAVFITMVNAFMNAPQGFDIVNGQLIKLIH